MIVELPVDTRQVVVWILPDPIDATRTTDKQLPTVDDEFRRRPVTAQRLVHDRTGLLYSDSGVISRCYSVDNHARCWIRTALLRRYLPVALLLQSR